MGHCGLSCTPRTSKHEAILIDMAIPFWHKKQKDGLEGSDKAVHFPLAADTASLFHFMFLDISIVDR